MANLAPTLVYWHRPAPLFTARVNAPGAIVYPVQDIPFDGVTVGAYTDLSADQLVTFGSAEGLDDLGRTRLRAAATSTTLKISRASQGYEDGQVDILDNAWIHVYPDFRVHSKIATFGSDHDEYKDTDIEVNDLTAEPPPVAIMGPDRARRIDATSGLVRFFFDWTGSYAVADGATITDYACDAGDGTFVLGTSATDSQVYIDFPAGVRYVSLTVVDSNGKSHSGRRLVLAHDPANSLCVSGMQVQRITRTQTGLSVPLRLLQDLPRADYPDGAHVLIFEDRDPNVFGSPDPADWSDLLFSGWHSVDEASSTAQETHLRRETVLTCVDVLGRLDGLPGFNQRIEVPDEVEGLTWGEMPAANMDKFLVYLIHWHSTAASVADFFPSGTWDEYPFVMFDSGGDTLYNQLQRQAARIVPDHNFTSDRYGRMRVVVNPMYQNPADRTATTQNSLTVQAWSEIRFDYNRNPRVHTLRGSALLTQTEWLIIDDEKALVEPVFSIAPGTVPAQGGSERKLGERLAQSQQALNDTIGHHYARQNARYGDINVTLNLNADPWDFDPAAFTWVQLITTAATAPQRGLDFETIRCLVKEVSIDYTYGEEATTWRGRVVLERETVGLPALTEVHEDALPVGEQPEPPPPFVPPDFGDPSIFYGDINPYVLWSGNHVFRTWDLQAATPSWHLIDNGISGNIYDCQYVNVDENTIGAWLMTSTAIWWCADILAFIPVWTAVLPIATVQAAEAAPIDGSSGFKSMFHYWSAPGHLCVATGPVASDSENRTWPHAYFWVTEDFGANWTMVDMDSFLFATGGYCYTSIYAMNVFRSVPGTIYCVRSTPTYIGNNSEMCVFLSSDLGYTWSKGAIVREDLGANQQVSSLLHPFPDADDPSYVVAGNFGPSDYIGVARSVDEWATSTVLTNSGTPTGYTRMANLWRVNSRTFDPLHVMGWFLHTSSGFMHLLESYDSGATWALLWNSGIVGDNIPNTSVGTAQGGAAHNTPNGWPPDVDQWVVVRAVVSGGSTTGVVQMTLDNFATAPTSKVGNLSSLLGGSNWQSGPCDGFALPKIGLAASDPPHAQGIVLRTASATGVQSAPTASIASTGVVEGDTVLLHLRLADNIAPTGVPSGFALVSNGEVTGTASIRIYSKVAGPSEPATYDFTFASGSARLGLAAIYSVEGRALVLDASANQSNGTSANWIAPSVTTTQVNTLLMCFYSSAATNQESIPQTGMTKGYDTTGANGVHMQYQTRGVVGATGTRTMSITSQTSRTVTTAWREVF